MTERFYKTLINSLTTTNHILFDLSHDANEFVELITHIAGSNNDANAFDVWASRGINQDFAPMCTVVTAAGQMTVRGSARLYNDTMTVTEVDKSFEAIEASTAADDCAKIYFNRNAYSHFLIIATVLNSTNLRAEICTMNRAGIPVVA